MWMCVLVKITIEIVNKRGKKNNNRANIYKIYEN